jgi:methionyl-tRNA formyltransferase
MAGERRTGIALMQMEEGLDTGPVFTARSLEIQREETAGELADRLAALAAVVTREDVPKVVLGERSAVPQDHALATHAPPLTRADGALDFSRPAEALVNQICGLSPRPGAHVNLVRTGSAPRGLKVLRARRAAQIQSAPPGTVIIDGTRLLVATGEGLLEIVEAQLEGKRALPARDLVNGRSLQEGDRLVSDVERPS